MLISPAEPAAFLQLGQRSSSPELYGADFLFAGHHGLIGVQRKEVKDLISSARDKAANGPRLNRELAKMSALHHAILLIEGRWMWATNGTSMLDPTVSRDYVRGIMWSVQAEGIWVVETDGVDDTVGVLKGLEKWAQKQHHRLVLRRNPGPRWDQGSEAWAVHFAQGLDGCGTERAVSLVRHFDGHLPIQWNVPEKKLTEVPGIGKGLASRWAKILTSCSIS